MIKAYIDNRGVSEEFIYSNLIYLTKLLRPELIYNHPINKKWKSLINKLELNILLIDFDNRISLFLFLINKVSEKINVFYLYNNANNHVNEILSYLA